MLQLDISRLPGSLRLGTSSFSSRDWKGGFYPEDAPPAEFLEHYSRQLNTVEIDATWHAMPARRTAQAWADKVPEGFVFSLKVPKGITHESGLEDCGYEWEQFLDVTSVLGPKRGPLLFQFPYVAKGEDPHEYETGDDFRRRLENFLPLMPEGLSYAVEVRNRAWVAEPLLSLLRSRRIALVLSHYYTMPDAAELMRRLDPITADFSYVRFLGNHQKMDQDVARARADGTRNGDWGEILVDRSDETRSWVAPIRALLDRGQTVYAYFNNHYAGFAPGSLELFLKIWDQATEAGAKGTAGS